jgi:thiol:disulfide interchange protein
MRPSLDPNRFDVEAEQAADALRARRLHADVAQHLASRYKLLRVDMTRRDSPNQALGKQYNIEVYPTLMLYNSSGGEVARCYGLSATDLMRWLKSDGQAVKQYIVE